MVEPLRSVPPKRGRRSQDVARPADWLRGTRILVVEDHLDSRHAMRMMAESFGATVRLAAEGHEGLAIASEWTPDLILCDLRMRGMDGYTFLRRLREEPRFQAVPVVAVSALGSDADVRRTWLAGFESHLVKPLDYDVLAGLLERLFWGRRPR
jgi:two-component system CheB/CheR fusion protein